MNHRIISYYVQLLLSNYVIQIYNYKLSLNTVALKKRNDAKSDYNFHSSWKIHQKIDKRASFFKIQRPLAMCGTSSSSVPDFVAHFLEAVINYFFQ